jgi:ubiquitin carboxyl-terminal hydrolase 48
VEQSFQGNLPMYLIFWLPYTYLETERIYYKQHPLFVTQFDAANVETEQGTHWISKRWLRGELYNLEHPQIQHTPDWRLAKPKMHVASQDDPAPDSAEFETDIRCEHGGLSLNSANRARISTEVS